MADETSQPIRKGRKLPPMNLDRDDIDIERTVRKARKKKVLKEADTDSVASKSKPKTKATVQSIEELDTSETKTVKRKKKKPVGNSREALVSEGEALSDRPQPPAKKKKKKSKAYQPTDGTDNLGLAAELADLQEDVVTDEDETIDAKWTTVPVMKSEPLNKIFVEKDSGFKSKNKERLIQKRAIQEELRREAPTEAPTHGTTYYALLSHKVFRTICVHIQGLFAGIALWHVISSWIFSTKSTSDFLHYYNDLAMPVSAMYYFLFAIVTVGSLDRYDIGSPTKRLFTRCCTCQSGGISIVIYLTGMIFTTSVTHLDDKISLYGTDDDAWGDNVNRQEDDLATWRILNLMRGLMAVLGWVVISLRPQTDRLSKTLYASDEDIFGNMPGTENV